MSAATTEKQVTTPGFQMGKKSWWGMTIAPPTFLYSIDSSIAASRLLGTQWIHGRSRWRNYRPVEVGDRIAARARVIKVEEKHGRRGLSASAGVSPNRSRRGVMS